MESCSGDLDKTGEGEKGVGGWVGGFWRGQGGLL